MIYTKNRIIMAERTLKTEPFDNALFRIDPAGVMTMPFSTEFEKSSTQGLGDGANENDENIYGVPAIMNWYAITTLTGASTKGGGDNTALIDNEGKRRWYEESEGFASTPTTSKLIIWGSEDSFGRRPYHYSDFVFLKHFDLIQNNHLITLRRYPYPTTDSLEFPGMLEMKDAVFSPMAQALTYIGEDTGNSISSFFDMTAGFEWEDFKAEVWDNSTSGNGADQLGGLAKALGVLSGDTTSGSIGNAGLTPLDPYEQGPYMNRIMGPVNRIDPVKRRKPGLIFNQEISLKFHYSARAIGGINSKAAMLDIIANLLALTYAVAPFWGGANRFRGGTVGYPWRGMKAWYSGDPEQFFNAVLSSVSDVGENISNFFGSLLDNPLEALKSLATKGAKFGMARAMSGNKPQTHGLRAILTGEPVGEWHLTVGNPLNPTMEIGNLVCKSIKFETNEELGPDDFPTELTATITLEHGMPRDRDAIESMFNKGKGRIYTLPDEFEEGLPSANETAIDKYTGDNNPYANEVMGGVEDGKKRGSKTSGGNTDARSMDRMIKSGKAFGLRASNETYKLAGKVSHGWKSKK